MLPLSILSLRSRTMRFSKRLADKHAVNLTDHVRAAVLETGEGLSDAWKAVNMRCHPGVPHIRDISDIRTGGRPTMKAVTTLPI